MITTSVCVGRAVAAGKRTVPSPRPGEGPQGAVCVRVCLCVCARPCVRVLAAHAAQRLKRLGTRRRTRAPAMRAVPARWHGARQTRGRAAPLPRTLSLSLPPHWHNLRI
jgi:hypothetical protein